MSGRIRNKFVFINNRHSYSSVDYRIVRSYYVRCDERCGNCIVTLRHVSIIWNNTSRGKNNRTRVLSTTFNTIWRVGCFQTSWMDTIITHVRTCIDIYCCVTYVEFLKHSVAGKGFTDIRLDRFYTGIHHVVPVNAFFWENSYSFRLRFRWMFQMRDIAFRNLTNYE